MNRSNPGLIGEPVRCTCNKLLMTVFDDKIIVKCSRCKRFMVLETKGIISIQIHDLDEEELEQLLRGTLPPGEEN